MSETKETHPLNIAFGLAIEQALSGKGARHGGGIVPFYEQQWVGLADHHGIGGLTFQAAKKANESGTKKDDDEAWEREVLGAMVYLGMAILHRRGLPTIDGGIQ